MDLDEALDQWDVTDDDWNEQGPKGWWAVVGPDGIVAYFATETDACFFRLAKVNQQLNG